GLGHRAPADGPGRHREDRRRACLRLRPGLNRTTMPFTGYWPAAGRIPRHGLNGGSDWMLASRDRGTGALAAIVLLAAWLPSSAAQATPLPGQVRCESSDARRVHCPMDTSRGVL